MWGIAAMWGDTTSMWGEHRHSSHVGHDIQDEHNVGFYSYVRRARVTDHKICRTTDGGNWDTGD